MKKPVLPSDQAHARGAVPTTATGRHPSPPRVGEAAHEMIAQRAYTLWELEGCRPGDDQRHWFSAERELQGSPLSDHQS
jgi:hypothetical protein